MVRCRLDSIGRASVRTRKVIAKLDGTVSAEAESVIVPVDAKAGRSRLLSGEERAALEAALVAAD